MFDKIWRKKAINELKVVNPKKILDVATGTGDMAIEALRLNPDKVVGIDISEGMMSFGREKLKKAGITNIVLEKGDSENINYPNNEFDAVMVAFGVRNFENLEKGLTEMNRVMRKQGKVALLEFSKPASFPFKQGYNFYFNNMDVNSNTNTVMMTLCNNKPNDSLNEQVLLHNENKKKLELLENRCLIIDHFIYITKIELK